MCQLVYFEGDDLRKKLRAVSGKQLEWEALTCSGQTRPVVFKLLGRAPKCPRGCLRSP